MGNAPKSRSSLPDEAISDLTNYLGALANEKRLRLLRFLVEPHYLEEIASHLGLTRQSARAHVQQLLEIGVIRRVQGQGDHGAVTDYVVVPERLFAIQESFSQIGGLSPDLDGIEEPEVRMVTQALATGGEDGDEAALCQFVLVHGLRIGQRTQLTGGGPWLVGREATAQLCLDYDPFVSTRHAEVRRTEAGGFEVVDLYSTNGTFVDFRAVERGGTTPIDHGDILRVGRTLLVFKRPS